MRRKQGRRVQVGFVLASGIATGLVVVGPAACGSEEETPPNTHEAIGDAARVDGRNDVAPIQGPDGRRPDPPPRDGNPSCPSYLIELPDAGSQADPGALCTLSVESVSSNAAAVVSLGAPSFGDAGLMRSSGSIAIPPDVLARVVGEPALRIEGQDPYSAGPLAISDMSRTAAGFDFAVSWGQSQGDHLVTVRLTLDCADAGADAGTVLVTSRTTLALCDNGDYSQSWKGAGEECTVCRIIAEMAPSPVVSDNQGDDLPLGRVVQLRVIELARAGNQVLLFAESDAGADSDYTWNVSCGSLERLDADLVLWTLPDAAEGTPFGQLGVWNEHGAAVENFLWAVAA